MPDIGVVDADSRRDARVGRRCRACGRRGRGRPHAQPAARLRRLRARSAPPRRRRRPGPPRAARARAPPLPDSSTACSPTRSGPSRSRCAAPTRRPIGVGRVESPRGATVVHRRAQRRPRRTGPASHRLVRQLARRRLRGGGEPSARLPAHQQELRALLRLRRPLMLTLLRDLRSSAARPGSQPPDRTGSLAVRHVDCGSCNGCEHELTLVSGPTSTSRGSASASSHRRDTPTFFSSPDP